MSNALRADVAARILVVEDEDELCVLLADQLESAGYQPVCVSDDETAHRTLDAEHRALTALVVDINLGRGTTGYDVARYARRLNPSLPVIYTTGGAAESFTAHQVEGARLLEKPFTREELLAALEQAAG
ncbi:MAG TPA: response regulator [Caulobacteraceae bacterium]|nr:response regulator [Caulobacteraceae bacterium]